jgi:lipopolysaccharide transport system permease protein
MIWTFFSTTTTTLGHSLVANAHLITKVFFPRLVIPISGVVGRLVDFAVAFGILALPMIYYRVLPGPTIFALPFLILLLVFFTLALGMWIAALNVKYRDVGLALPVLMQLGMFVTPVVYPVTMVPAKWRLLYSLNPMVGIVENIRAALFNQTFNFRSLVISVLFTVVLLPYATYIFRRQERVYADII